MSFASIVSFPRLIFGAGKRLGFSVVNKTRVNISRLLTVSSHLITGRMAYTTIERGSPNTADYRLFIKNSLGVPVSPFHDIPLYADKENGVFNMVVEIPRWTNAKMEISKEESLNPIKQDVKKDKLRFVKNIFPHKGYIWNYGALPQTFEDPEHETPETETKGDSDPIDVCEIGHKIHPCGAVIQVKPIGVMCLIDEGETDWKVLAIDVTDPLADKINDVDAVEKHYPGLLRATYEWFKYYKVPDDKPENKFAFNGETRSKEYALTVIEETHDQWRTLVTKEGDSNINSGQNGHNGHTMKSIPHDYLSSHKFCLANVNVKDSPFIIDQSAANAVVEKTASPGPGVPESQEVNKWYYVIPSPPSPKAEEQ